jgi:hypothetical protein
MNRRDTNGQSLLIQSLIVSSEEWAVMEVVMEVMEVMELADALPG